MAVELASAYVSLLPSFRGGVGSIQKEAAKMGQAASKSMAGEVEKSSRRGGGIGKAWLLAAGAAGAAFGSVKIFKGFIAEAEDARKVSKLTAAVLKSTGGAAHVSAKQVDALATALSNKSGVDDEVIASGENVLLTFTKVRNEAGKGNDIFNQGATLALDMSKALGTDLQGSVIQVGKALNDPVKGITALQRVGVSFTKQQKEQIKTLVKSGDTLGAQKVILKELKTEFGGAAAAGATTTEKLAVIWGNLQEQIGTALLPILDKVAGWLGTVLPKAVGFAGKAFGKAKDFVSTFAQIMVSEFKDPDHTSGGFWGFVENIGIAVRNLWDVLKRVGRNIVLSFRIIVAAFKDPDITSAGWYGFMERIGIAARGLWETAKTVFPKIKDAIVNALSGIVGWVQAHWDQIGDVLSKAFEGLQTAVKWVITQKPVLIGILTAIGGGYALMAAQATIAAAAQVAAAAVPIAIGAAVAALVAGLIYAYQKVKWFRTAVDATAKALIASFHWVRDNYKQVGANIAAVFVTTFQVIRTVVGGFITAFNFMWERWGGTIKLAVKIVWDTIVSTIKLALGVIRGIIKTVTALIRGDWSGAWNGIKQIFSAIWDNIKATLRTGVDALKLVLKAGVAQLRTLWAPLSLLYDYFRDHVLNPIGRAFTRLKDDATTAIRNTVNAVKSAWSGLTAIYDFFNQHIITPVMRAINTFESAMGQAFDRAVSAVRTAWNKLAEVVKTPIKLVIGFYNAGIVPVWNNIIGRINSSWKLGTVSQNFATGGKVPGSGNRDTVPAMLTPGEFVLTKDTVANLGTGVLEFLNKTKGKKGTTDPGIFGYAAGGPVKTIEEAQSWARAQAGKPYVFPNVGPGSYDCSGFTSALVNFILGLYPYSRRHSSGTVGSDPALRAGVENPGEGLMIGARPPYMTNSQGARVGHVVATIGGMNAEATPPAVRVGAAARGWSALPQHFFMPGFGLSEQDKWVIGQMVGLHDLKSPSFGGPPMGDLLTKLIGQIPGKMFGFLFGKLPSLIVDGIKKLIPGLEHGGTIRRDGMYLAGERRPELLWANKGEYMQARVDGFGVGRGRDLPPVNVYNNGGEVTATTISQAIVMSRMQAA